jgi:hypothetical protein
MGRPKQHPVDPPACIFRHRGVLRRQIGLALKIDRVATQTGLFSEKQIPQHRQAFARVIVAPAWPMAVRPLIVTGCVNQRSIHTVHVIALAQVDRHVAGPSSLDVTERDNRDGICGDYIGTR